MTNNIQTDRFRQTKNACSIENIVAVRENVTDEPTTRSQQLGISHTNLWRILNKDLHFHAYKIQLTQELKERDHLYPKNFVGNLNKEQINHYFLEKLSLAMKQISH